MDVGMRNLDGIEKEGRCLLSVSSGFLKEKGIDERLRCGPTGLKVLVKKHNSKRSMRTLMTVYVIEYSWRPGYAHPCPTSPGAGRLYRTGRCNAQASVQWRAAWHDASMPDLLVPKTQSESLPRVARHLMLHCRFRATMNMCLRSQSNDCRWRTTVVGASAPQDTRHHFPAHEACRNKGIGDGAVRLMRIFMMVVLDTPVMPLHLVVYFCASVTFQSLI